MAGELRLPGELELGGRSGGREPWRLRGKSKVREDLVKDLAIGEERDDPALAAAVLPEPFLGDSAMRGLVVPTTRGL